MSVGAQTVGRTPGVGATATVKVPATSANLGPGYDCAGLALALTDTLEARLLGDGELEIDVVGEGADSVPKDDSHLVVRSMARGFAEADAHIPGLHLTCHNVIPHGRGLGSSSAAIVGGLVLARELMPDGHRILTAERLVSLATELEGHPDNVAPAVLGGMTIAWTHEAGGRAIRISPNPRLQPVVAIPIVPLATQRARELLPAAVPHADAAANAARAALLVPALTNHLELLHEATHDLLHQDYRRFAYPQSHALVTALRALGIPAMISGAGPTVIAIGVSDTGLDGQAVEAAVVKALATQGGSATSDFRVEQLAVASDGAVAI